MLDHITTCIFVQAPMPTSVPIICSVSTLQGILEFWPNGLLAHLFDLLDSNHVTMPITNDGLTGMVAPLASHPAPFSSSKQVKHTITMMDIWVLGNVLIRMLSIAWVFVHTKWHLLALN